MVVLYFTDLKTPIIVKNKFMFNIKESLIYGNILNSKSIDTGII